jgi:hypothetical protein
MIWFMNWGNIIIEKGEKFEAVYDLRKKNKWAEEVHVVM